MVARRPHDVDSGSRAVDPVRRSWFVRHSARPLSLSRSARQGVPPTSGARAVGRRRKREPGASPGLPRSGERERTPSRSTEPDSLGKRRPVGARLTVACDRWRRARESEDLPACPRDGARTSEASREGAPADPAGSRFVARPLPRRPGPGDRRGRGTVMTASTIHGYPRIGARRELKAATEAYWDGRVTAGELEATGRELRRQAWTFLREAGIDEVPSGHFSFYDHVLDTIALVGAVPERFRPKRPERARPGRPDAGGGDPGVDLDTYFALARGGTGAPALEMTKWFDTNYHYLVPELGPDTRFR